MDSREILAQNLYKFRKREHISQMEFAFRTDISRETVSLIERTAANVSLDVIDKITAYTNYTAAELLTENFVENHPERSREKE